MITRSGVPGSCAPGKRKAPAIEAAAEANSETTAAGALESVSGVMLDWPNLRAQSHQGA
jgi:hypothetical protein